MREQITSRSWWGAALRRVLRTFLATLVGTLPGLLSGDILLAASTIALAAILSLATSLAGLPELTDVTLPWWRAALQRAGRTLGQMLAAAAASAAVLSDITWAVVGQAVLAAVVTLILAMMDALPEVAPEEPLVDPAQTDAQQKAIADCPSRHLHNDAGPFRYCSCGWTEEMTPDA